MRVVFSRKGFDSSSGGVASPILPDGRMISLPIPSSSDSYHIGDINVDGVDIGQLVSDLTGGRYGEQTKVHLDPDLREDALNRQEGWRPAFGQVGAAQGHLRNQNVGVGDLFLYFGWFRHVEFSNGSWRYADGSMDIHAFFGWLQIGEILAVSGNETSIIEKYDWLNYHPHVSLADRFSSENNTIYLSSNTLSVNEHVTSHPGAGVFKKFTPKLQLTSTGMSRSYWRLPSWFMPIDGHPALSMHSSLKRWQKHDDEIVLRTVGRGQEFVLDCEAYPDSENWLMGLFDGALK